MKIKIPVYVCTVSHHSYGDSNCLFGTEAERDAECRAWMDGQYGWTYDESKTFDENWEAFKEEAEFRNDYYTREDDSIEVEESTLLALLGKVVAA